MPQNIISTMQITSQQCCSAIKYKALGWLQIIFHQFFSTITYYIMAHCKLHVVKVALQ